ncbi:SDR family NAD(P)-dependent oxidoreductase [Rhizobium sp. VS19-DR104.2]|uniref:SDR family NAD(P)-dependent oxidoreductase n=1 Tax=unclassified Rhizobium TaxID=2613769 RepID=UPI001C5B11A0|nr:MULTISPECIES: SDR family NAD(P)-dependent oxidoreductase [unclassified Rhizobium]MBZ5762477.1 SDR family NAD(P)-dependent oxidoreductase [Rhizobium sp. VS19-DR96]MBZ5768508.1 SDR family NAD(P)-dependent oxidoreductase [Rhizobium sp. VS19-DR129.2]MBZ5776026.1 SDR family NAD(P)-dependent oxidoreductase [Rhizobium sp. VS19-DRK62.2]MBZ5787202.1 SDR family NAD(P)-dependent oxidoreductase [Rhizobium sp. VS19-DR121]MBZ5804555.1 SDR family NAD(P)-dependent oxidoreductase [Rhizobium sp. VS19-DR181]
MAETTRTILITGSTDGVGRRVAERLAAPYTTTLIHGRDRDRGESLVQAIIKSGGKVAFYSADLSALSEIRELADTIRRDHSCLDVLINNAGIGVAGAYPRRCESPDGFELRFAVNYLSGFLLARLLLPLLKRSASARIVNVASIGQQAIDFSDVMLTRGYSGQRAYCQSKLAQILFTFDLAEELKGTGVTVNALHPATYMATAMVRGDGVSPVSSVDEGADAILNLAISPDLQDKSGLYFDGLRPSRAQGQAFDADARRQLRALSFELTGLSHPVV